MAAASNTVDFVSGQNRVKPKHRGWSIVAVVFGALLIWCFRLSGPIDLRWDAGVYYELGASLAKMQGYRIGSEPGSPQGVQYPPALPLLVAGHAWVLGTVDPAVVAPALRITFAGIFLAYGLAVLALARRWLPPFWAVIACYMTLFQSNALIASELLFTEIPFSLVGVLLVLLLSGDSLKNRPFAREGLAFLLATTAFGLRTAGIVMLGLWIIDAGLRRQWRLLVIRAVVAVVPFVAWQSYVKQVQHSHDYVSPAYSYQRADYQYYNVPYAENLRLVDPFAPELGQIDLAGLARRVGQNFRVLPRVFGEAVNTNAGFWYWTLSSTQRAVVGFAPVPPRLSEVFVTMFGLAALGGLLLLVRHGQVHFILVVTGTVLLASLTPWPTQFGRYLIPGTPFLAIGMLYLIRHLANRFSALGSWTKRMTPFLTGATICLLLGMQGFGAWYVFTSGQRSVETTTGRVAVPGPFFYFDGSWVRWSLAMDWIKGNTAADAVIATTASHLCHLQTGRRSVLPPMEVNPVEAVKFMDTVPVDYLVVDEMTFLDAARRYGLPAIEAEPKKWRLAYQIGETRVFARLAPGTLP